MTYLRFFALGDAPNNLGAVYEKALAARRFTALVPKDDVNESAGWVPLEAPFDDERPITRDTFLFSNSIAVSYREDKFAIPRPVIKRAVEKRLEKIEKDEKKPRDEMGKAFIKTVEAAVVAELKVHAIPRSKVIDLVWDLERREVRVFGRGTIVTERMASLFERTFQVRLEQANYAARAFNIDLADRAQSVLERLSPGWLFPEAWAKAGARDDDEVSDAG